MTIGNVLVIEDEASSRELFATALRQAGWNVRSAVDGLSAVRVVELFTPDVIVLDLLLPGASGLAVIDRLRSLATTKTTPVIAMSGNESALDQARAHPEIVATIRKPFAPDELVRAVARAKRYTAIQE